jgi:hypothetical protein
MVEQSRNKYQGLLQLGRSRRRLDRGCDGDPDRPLFDLAAVAERVAAAARAARELPFPFTLTARAEASCAAGRISTTRSRACKPSSGPAPTCSSRRPPLLAPEAS